MGTAMNVFSGEYQQMHRLYERKRTLEQQVEVNESMAQMTARSGEQNEQIALNKLITAARNLPDEPYDPQRDRDYVLYDQRAEEARRELERVNREIDEAESRRSADHRSGAGC